MRDGILTKKTANAEANEFLKRIACVNLCTLSCLASVKGLLLFCSNHSSLRLHGDRVWQTTGLAKNVILPDSKYLRMARKAGVQRIASPMGEGSQTNILSVGFCDLGFAVHIAIFDHA